MRHVHVVHDVRRVRVPGFDLCDGQKLGRPEERLVNHVLPVFVAAATVVVMADLAGRKVGDALDLGRTIAVLQVWRAVALFAAAGIGGRDIGLSIDILGRSKGKC